MPQVAKVVAPVVIKLENSNSEVNASSPNEYKVPVRAERIGENVKLTFAFQKQVPAAIFQRSRVIWAVFDSPEPLDLGNIANVLKGKVENIELTQNANVQIVRFSLKDRQLLSTLRETNNWIVTIGNILLKPAQPLLLKRGLRKDGYSKFTVDLNFAGHVHWLEDREFDEHLVVVTAQAPARGMIKNQEFVEFSAFKTSHGIALRPYADDLTVRLNHDQLVITRPQGLTISSGGARQYEAGRKAVREGGAPGFLDLAKWSSPEPRQFHKRLDELTVLTGDEDKEKRVQARLEMARLYMGRLWGPEALANLDLALETDPGLKADPVYNAMRGVAAILSNRFDVALKNLRVHALAGDIDTKLWRALMAAKRQDWDTAWRLFNEATTATPKYPFHVQMEFRLAAMEADIETGDVTAASSELDAIPSGIKGPFAARIALLKGRLYEALGRTQDAYDAYKNAIHSPLRKIEVAARYRLTDLKLRNGKLSTTEAIEELENLAFMWRGDDTELRVLHLLGRLYRKIFYYRRALETMKMAVKSFSDRPESRVIQSEMENLFKELFLRNMAEKMEPLKALSLFYDYSALTPPGRLGDDMIRKLADRLVGVDLLTQAEEILEHQVSTRLHGAARAQVAAKLAYIYLLDRKPELALRAIRKSRQSVMPKSITRQRNILESRALAELGQVDAAMELLGAMKGEDVERLKAEALWTGRNWQSAGEQIERILDNAWKSDQMLSEGQRLDVLRAGISFALADDRLGLDRLREKFIDKMTNSPDAAAFSLITETMETAGVAFNDLARKIASLDTLSVFLKDYRKRYVDKGGAGLPKT
jgi:predicted negative regulator of RcsB-dependent stress response